MSAREKYEAALERANAKENDPKRLEKSARARERYAQKKQIAAHTSAASPSPVPLPQDVLTNVEATAQDEERQPQANGLKTCLCHKEQNRPHDSHGCCKATVDSIRFSAR